MFVKLILFSAIEECLFLFSHKADYASVYARFEFCFDGQQMEKKLKVLELKDVRTLSSRIASIIREALLCCHPRWLVLPLSSIFNQTEIDSFSLHQNPTSMKCFTCSVFTVMFQLARELLVRRLGG